MWCSRFVVVILVALVGSAAAKGVKKPTPAQAIETATSWAAKLEVGESRPLTAAAFTALISVDGPDSAPCSKATAKDEAAITKSLDCVREHAPIGTELAVVKTLKKSVPYLSMWNKQLTAAMKTST